MHKLDTALVALLVSCAAAQDYCANQTVFDNWRLVDSYYGWTCTESYQIPDGQEITENTLQTAWCIDVAAGEGSATDDYTITYAPCMNYLMEVEYADVPRACLELGETEEENIFLTHHAALLESAGQISCPYNTTCNDDALHVVYDTASTIQDCQDEVIYAIYGNEWTLEQAMQEESVISLFCGDEVCALAQSTYSEAQERLACESEDTVIAYRSETEEIIVNIDPSSVCESDDGAAGRAAGAFVAATVTATITASVTSSVSGSVSSSTVSGGGGGGGPSPGTGAGPDVLALLSQVQFVSLASVLTVSTSETFGSFVESLEWMNFQVSVDGIGCKYGYDYSAEFGGTFSMVFCILFFGSLLHLVMISVLEARHHMLQTSQWGKGKPLPPFVVPDVLVYPGPQLYVLYAAYQGFALASAQMMRSACGGAVFFGAVFFLVYPVGFLVWRRHTVRSAVREGQLVYKEETTEHTHHFGVMIRNFFPMFVVGVQNAFSGKGGMFDSFERGSYHDNEFLKGHGATCSSYTLYGLPYGTFDLFRKLWYVAAIVMLAGDSPEVQTGLIFIALFLDLVIEYLMLPFLNWYDCIDSLITTFFNFLSYIILLALAKTDVTDVDRIDELSEALFAIQLMMLVLKMLPHIMQTASIFKSFLKKCCAKHHDDDDQADKPQKGQDGAADGSSRSLTEISLGSNRDIDTNAEQVQPNNNKRRLPMELKGVGPKRALATFSAMVFWRRFRDCMAVMWDHVHSFFVTPVQKDLEQAVRHSHGFGPEELAVVRAATRISSVRLSRSISRSSSAGSSKSTAASAVPTENELELGGQFGGGRQRADSKFERANPMSRVSTASRASTVPIEAAAPAKVADARARAVSTAQAPDKAERPRAASAVPDDDDDTVVVATPGAKGPELPVAQAPTKAVAIPIADVPDKKESSRMRAASAAQE